MYIRKKKMASLSLPSNPLMKTDTVGADLPIEVEYTQEDYEEALLEVANWVI